MTSNHFATAEKAAFADEYHRFLNCMARKSAQKQFENAIKQRAAKGESLSPQEHAAFIQKIGAAQLVCDGLDR